MNSSCFFVLMVNVGFTYVAASSCWLEGRRRLLWEKRNRWDPTGAQATRRLSGRPRKAKPCMEINSGVTSSPIHVPRLFVFRLYSFSYVL